jgi:hypothetical protein
MAREPIRLAGLVLALGAVTICVLRDGGFAGVDLIGLPVVLAGCALMVTTKASPRGRFLVAAAAVFAAVWLMCGFASGTAGRSAALAAAAGCIAASVLLGQSLDRHRGDLTDHALLAVAAAGGIVSLAGWALHVRPWGLPFDGAWRLAGPFAYPNAAGLFFAIGLVRLSVSQRFAASERLLLGAVLAAALLATQSRGAFVALAVGLLLAGRRLCSAVVAGTAAVVITLVTNTASGADRVAEWSAAARQGWRHLLVGGGPERDLLIHNFRGDAIARYAHNEPLQVFAGAGLVGVVLLGVLLVAVARAVPTRRGRAILATLAVGGLVDFSWHFVALVAYAGWLAALDLRNEDDASDGLATLDERVSGRGFG